MLETCSRHADPKLGFLLDGREVEEGLTSPPLNHLPETQVVLGAEVGHSECIYPFHGFSVWRQPGTCRDGGPEGESGGGGGG